MRIKISTGISAVCFLIFIFFSVSTVTGQSHEDAIPVGGSVKTQINCSKRAGGIEVYDATITLLEIQRGTRAFDLLKKPAKPVKDPDNGFEYLVARVSFKMTARGAPGDKTFDLDRPLQFTAFSENFEEYESPSISPPEPMLRQTVPADKYAEGWIVLSVKKDDKHPLLMFDPSSGGAWSRGKISFFKLYR